MLDILQYILLHCYLFYLNLPTLNKKHEHQSSNKLNQTLMQKKNSFYETNIYENNIYTYRLIYSNLLMDI